MSSIQSSILSEAPAVKFAQAELLKYAEQVSKNLSYSFILGQEQDFLQNGLMKMPVFHIDETIDAFQLLENGNDIYVIGSNPRSVLFGVYHALKKIFGYKWVHFSSKENAVDTMRFQRQSPIIIGKMKRRGLVVENYNEPEFLLQLIDWAAKHYINELFFTFMLWDKVKHILVKEIENRGLSITIGGHSMHYLAEGLSEAGKKQIDFSDDKWKSQIITKIKEYSRETSSIKRISLWPEDVGIEDDQQFLARYISFTELIQQQIPEVAVEHIAYNAGLSWDMLELPEDIPSSKSVHTLFAYWGRNYQQSFNKEDRAIKALENWCLATKAKDREITIFEYYSDHFMLGNLFPPLFQRIQDDLNLYSRMGIDQIVNLIVPYIPKAGADETDSLYPWKSVQLMNDYFFARLSWGDSFIEVEEDFYSIFGHHHSEAKRALKSIEKVLSEVSKWNVLLFPYRLVDPEKVELHEELHLIVDDLKKWKQEIDPLKGKAVTDLDDPYSMISFYIHYLFEKLKNYLFAWEEKESIR